MRLASLSVLAVATLLAACTQATGSQVAFKSDASQADAGDGTTADGDRTCTSGPCSRGGDLAFCVTTAADGSCSKAEYTHDGQTFTCNSCEDCASAVQQATRSCGNASGSSSSSSSGGSSSSSSSSSSGSSGTPPSAPSVSCTPINTTCTTGGQMSYCVTTTSGACSNIAYKYGGQTFSCGGCASCTDAYYKAYTVCQGAVGACNDLAVCCSQIQSSYQSSCNSSLSSYRGNAYGDVSCKSLLQSYRSSNLCP